MKKIILFSASALFLAATVASCGKSSKGKMDGEWNVDTFTQKSTNTSGGSTSTDEMKVSGSTITLTSNSGGSTSTSTGTVQEATYSIKKDGTWTRTFKYTISGTSGGFSYTDVSTITTSGKWDFANGVGEFKKNERVLFSTLSETNTEVSTFGNVSSTSTLTDTYADGESTEVYVVTESKKKSLKLSKKGANNSTVGGSSSSSTEDKTIEMSAK